MNSLPTLFVVSSRHTVDHSVQFQDGYWGLTFSNKHDESNNPRNRHWGMKVPPWLAAMTGTFCVFQGEVPLSIPNTVTLNTSQDSVIVNNSEMDLDDYGRSCWKSSWIPLHKFIQWAVKGWPVSFPRGLSQVISCCTFIIMIRKIQWLPSNTVEYGEYGEVFFHELWKVKGFHRFLRGYPLVN